MEIDYSAIGKRIGKCRKELNLTQQQLAEMSDLSDTNISHIERGATKLSLPSLIAITNALNTTTDYLLMDELLKDCGKEEFNLLYNICKAALENGR